jgi:murein DD-endopeptidase MepM/ murein hydrolase activator NlpD
MGFYRRYFWRLLGAAITAILFVGLSLGGAETTPPRAPDQDMEELRQAVLRAWTRPDAVVTELQRSGSWAVGALVEMREGAFVTGEGTQFVARWQDSAWDIAFEGTPTLRAWLPAVPDALLSPAAKASLDYASFDPAAPLRMPDNSPQESPYKLPWPAGATFFITRAWATGACEHGSHAVDVSMPIGSPIVAMRSGIVAVVEQVSTDCGCAAGNAGTKLIIRHVPDDGLFDWYAHFGQGTVTAQVGEYVEQGQFLALSNQIGYTCGSGTCPTGTCYLGNCLPGPHLHFHVQDSNGERIYIPFADAGMIEGCTWVTSGNTDQTLPTIHFTTVPDNQTWYNTNQTLAWSIEDVSGVWGYSAAWDTRPPGPPPAVYQAAGQTDFSGLLPGQHRFTLRAWDLAPARHERVAELGWFGFDPIPPTAPEINTICPNQGQPVGRLGCLNPQFSWHSVEEHSGLSGAQAGYRFAWGRETDPPQFSAWQNKNNLQPLLTQAGLYRLDVQARDVAGNESATTSLSYRLGDYVWHDLNSNGIREAGEPGVSWVFLTLFANPTCTGAAAATAITNADGLYLFSGLAPGDYCVQINNSNFSPEGALSGWLSSPQDQGDDDLLDSDGDVSTHQAIATVTSSTATPGLDFGFWRSACLGDFIFTDYNTNGVQDGCTDPDDPFSCTEHDGIAGIPIHIVGGNGLTTTVTSRLNPRGLYLLESLSPGVYTITVSDHPQPDLWITTPAQRTVTLTSGECNRQVDFGFVSPTGLTLTEFQLAWRGVHPLITWRTSDERSVTGFDVYRAPTDAAERVRVNTALIPAHGPGPAYALQDSGLWSDTAAWYWLLIQPSEQWLGPWPLAAAAHERAYLPFLLRGAH